MKLWTLIVGSIPWLVKRATPDPLICAGHCNKPITDGQYVKWHERYYCLPCFNWSRGGTVVPADPLAENPRTVDFRKLHPDLDVRASRWN